MISRHKPNEQATPLSVGFVLLNRYCRSRLLLIACL